ncbi:hypothetical protein JL720_4137 [Aureococcus anophagefferens]|nr:hypothetical protein JL720_4137 [Aureococcus anophagefferens]
MSWSSKVVLLHWISTLLLLLQSAAGFDGAIAAAPDGFLQAAFEPWTRNTTSRAWTGGDVAQEYWTGAWRRGWGDDLPEALATLWSPQVAEMQPQWCDKTGSYVALTIPFGSTRVELRAAPAPEGPWTDPRKVYDIPPPQNDTTKFFCYATMQHDVASLPRNPSSPPPDLVFTYVCNGRTLADVFAPGAEASYIPQFVRLSFL